MKWRMYKIIYLLDIMMNIKNLNGPYNVEFSYLSFDPGLSSEIAITTTFSRKKTKIGMTRLRRLYHIIYMATPPPDCQHSFCLAPNA